MSRGLPYDSDAGRAYAGADHGPDDRKRLCRVGSTFGPNGAIRRVREESPADARGHREAPAGGAAAGYVARRRSELRNAAIAAWDEALSLGEEHGYRNAQVSVLAPTGTIAFMMDCDTTGVEPDIALVTYKRLVGGGMIKMVNRTVPLALRTLGYRRKEIEEIVDLHRRGRHASKGRRT